MANALSMQAQIGNPVQATMETAPVYSQVGEDAADDPAIWINTENPENSLVIGTDKNAGLYSYNLNGEIVQFLKAGALNNVDLRPDFIHSNKGEGSVILGFPDPPCPLVLEAYSVLSILSLPIKRIPKSAVHESLATEYLFIVSWALLILVAVLAKQLLKFSPVKVIDSLTLEVF